MISLTTLGATILTPLWAFLLHVAFSRRYSRAPRQKLAVLCCLLSVTLTTLSALILDWWSGADGRSTVFVAFAASGLAHVYFHFFNMSETARRIRLLIDLSRNRSSINETGGSYDNRLMVETRLERLLLLGQIRESNGKLYGVPGLLTVACRLVRLYERMLFPGRTISTHPPSEGPGSL